MNLLSVTGVIAASYLVGAIPVGLFIGKFNGIDVRRYGSGNIGATNISRVIGRSWGVTCFVLDFCKGLFPVIVAGFLFRADPVLSDLLPLVAAGAAIAGHIWPVFLRFKGGKGMSTSLGALLALSPAAVLLAMVGWYIIFSIWRYVSLASMAASALLPLGEVLAGGLLLDRDIDIATVAFLGLVCLVVLWRHKTNIKRLLEGRENRFIKEKEQKK